MGRLTKKLLFYGSLLFLWSIVSWVKIWPDYIFPTPWGVWNSFLEGIIDGSFLLGTLASLKRIFMGYGISVVLGMSLGFAIGRSKHLDETLGSLVMGLQALPSICWLPLAILWFGLNESAIIFVVVMGALLSITISTDSGIKNIPPIYINVGKNMGADDFKLIYSVLLPAALPAIISGLKQGWSFAWRSLMAGELLYVSMGLGQLLMMGRELNDMNRVLAVMLVLILIGLGFDRFIFVNIENKVRTRWGLS